MNEDIISALGLEINTVGDKGLELECAGKIVKKKEDIMSEINWCVICKKQLNYTEIEYQEATDTEGYCKHCGRVLEQKPNDVEKEEKLKFQEYKGCPTNIEHQFCPYQFSLKSLYEDKGDGFCKFYLNEEKCRQCWNLSLSDMRKNYRGEE